VKTTEIAT